MFMFIMRQSMVCTGFTLLHYPEWLHLPLIKSHDQPFAIELHFENLITCIWFQDFASHSAPFQAISLVHFPVKTCPNLEESFRIFVSVFWGLFQFCLVLFCLVYFGDRDSLGILDCPAMSFVDQVDSGQICLPLLPPVLGLTVWATMPNPMGFCVIISS